MKEKQRVQRKLPTREDNLPWWTESCLAWSYYHNRTISRKEKCVFTSLFKMCVLKNKIIISKLILNQSANRWKLGIQSRFPSFSHLAIRHFESIFLNYDVSKFCGYKKNCHCQAAKFISLSNFYYYCLFFLSQAG